MVFAAPWCASAFAMEGNGSNRPPIAAPVNKIAVGALPVVRSQAEVIEDVIIGLIPGLMAGHRGVEGVTFMAISADHVFVRRDFGAPRSNEPFDAGGLADIPIAIAVMQQLEKGALLPTQNAAGSTVERILTYQADVPLSALTGEVARIAGQPFAGYLAQRVFVPLKMSDSILTGGVFRTTAADMGRMMIALLNGGAAGEARVLDAASVEALERTHVLPHPAVAGFAYGFAEARRNGWRALQHDGIAPLIEARLVLVPEVKFGYFVLVRGAAGTAFWRTLDNTLFDRVFPPRDAAFAPPAGISAPGIDTARAVAGVYIAKAGVAPLTSRGLRLDIAARDDASLELSGAENAVLSAREGGYWSTDNRALAAVARNGTLFLSGGAYEPLPQWLRWDMYLLLAFGVAFIAAGLFTFEHRGGRTVYVPGNFVLAGGALSGALGLTALLVWLLAASP
jgi:Beta-lactamase